MNNGVIDDQLGKNDNDKRVNLKGQDLFGESITIEIGLFRDEEPVIEFSNPQHGSCAHKFKLHPCPWTDQILLLSIRRINLGNSN